MSNDAPKRLREIQEWFGTVIEEPIDAQSRLIPTPINQQADAFISPSATLEPFQRIELYAQQQWWRLLSALHENFPMLTRLFGTIDFNECIGKPALDAYPPHHWSIGRLGSDLVLWLEEAYHEPDRNLVLDVARLDWQINESLTARQLPPLTLDEITPELAQQRLTLQPHLHLLHLRADLFSFREQLLERDLDGWIGVPFPPIPKETEPYYAIFRNHNFVVTSKQLHPKEFEILTLLQNGSTLNDACDVLSEEEGTLLPRWCQEWAARQWLSVVL